MEMQQRIDKLEKERWLYLGVAALGGVAGLLGALVGVFKGGGGGATSGIVAVRDAKNLVRIQMGVDAEGAPRLNFIDPQKRIRQSIGLAADGTPQIRLFGETNSKNPVAALMCTADDLPKLELYDPQGLARGQMSVNPGGDATLKVIGPDGKVRVVIEDTPNGGSVVVNDRQGKKVFGHP